jgi:hypothetical protein
MNKKGEPNEVHHESMFNFASTGPNEFSARAIGGARFVSAINGVGVPTAGVSLPPGGNAWVAISDSTKKAK